MKQTLSRFWADDAGALIATEYLFVATILVIGVIIGLTNLRSALNAELTELGNAILALSQGYTINGQQGSGASVDGSGTIDIPGLLQPPTSVPPSAPSFIEVPPAN